MKQIITLQFGGIANAIADELWKLQSSEMGPEVDPAALLRHTRSGWAPRALVFDDKAGASKILSRVNTDDGTSIIRYDARDIVAIGNEHDTGSSWSTDGSAFTAGSTWVTEDILDNFRRLIEACDAVTGIQAITDMTSGFGSFAASFLAYVREECPRTALLVLGSAGSGQGFHSTSEDAATEFESEIDTRRTQASTAPVDSDALAFHLANSGVHERYARSTRAVNLALAFSAFGGSGDLGALFVPVCPGALIPRFAAAVESREAANFAVAAAWDTLLLPLRRAAATTWLDERGDVLECSRGPAACSRREGQAVWARMPSSSGEGSGRDDDRQPHRSGAERASANPLAALDASAGLPELVSLMRPSSRTAVSALTFSLNSPNPEADARTLGCTLHGRMPAHLGGFAEPQQGHAALQMSWLWSQPPDVAQSLAKSTPGSRASLESDARQAPQAHVLIARGVGGLAMADAAGSRYASSCGSYGEVLDTYLARSLCPRAAHAVMRTPLCIRADVDSLLSSWGGAVQEYHASSVHASVPAEGRGPMDRGGAALDMHSSTSAASVITTWPARAVGSTPLPGSAVVAVPQVLRSATAHLQSGPAYSAALSRLQSEFSVRDPRMLHLFASGGEGDIRELLAQAQEDTARLVDEYCVFE